MSLLMAKVYRPVMKQIIKVAIPRLKLDLYLNMYFRELDEILVFDAKEEGRVGDWVLIKELEDNLTIQVKHQVVKVVYVRGKLIDPISGKQSDGPYLKEDIDRSSTEFGLKPLLERFGPLPPDEPITYEKELPKESFVQPPKRPRFRVKKFKD